MNGRRLVILLACGAALAALITLATSAFWEHQKPLFQNGPKLVAALHRFCNDQMLHGRAVPLEISLHELVSNGYVTADDVTAFGGMEVSFFTRYDESRPQCILASVPAGRDDFTCLLVDGSVTQLSRRSLEEYRRWLAQENARANASSSQTNNLPPNRVSE